MHISFNGVIVPYTYNCPYAHYLRNIKHIFPIRQEMEELTEEEQSKRMFGIEQHELVSQYILGDLKEYEYLTDTIQWHKEHAGIPEEQKYYSTDYQVLPTKPEKGDFFSTRKDCVVRTPNKTYIADWKFGNPNFGAARYYDEVEFFLFLDSMEYPDVGEWEIEIHFPHKDYSLPKRIYNYNQIARVQQKFMRRIDRIIESKIHVANPCRLHCRFCDYRSEDTGGTGNCQFTSV